MTIIWDTVLSRFKLTSDSLQKMDMDLKTAVCLLKSLRTSLRGQFTNFETRARAVTGVTQTYHSETQHVSKRKASHDETAETKSFSFGVKSLKLRLTTQSSTVCCQDKQSG